MSETGTEFSYRATASGEVHIGWRGRTVTTLRAAAAKRFLTKVAGADAEGAQQLMARATGNFKRGNERR